MNKEELISEEAATDRPAVNISSVERDTGLSKDALRVWERRYGFPQPYRDAHGERIYPSDQVDKLRLLKRLLDQGHRPSKVIHKSLEDLTALCAEAETPTHSAEVESLLALVRTHDSVQLRQTLTQILLRDGLRRFVVEVAVPLNRAVGNAWMRGEIAVFEEHLYTEQMQSLMRNAIASVQLRGHSPRVLLTTLPTEQHGMGLLMVEALLTLEGVYCVPLGVETPATDIVAAAKQHKANAIGMSGLLVKSTVVMRENLEEMSRQNLDIPVMLGGAALTRNYVEEDCVRAYASGRVAYARDAFDGLHLMDRITGNAFDDYLAAVQSKRSGKARNTARTLGQADERAFRPVDVAVVQQRRRRLTADQPVLEPPFWGPRMVEATPKAIVPFINERSLYQFQWGFRKQGRSLDDFLGWAKQELRPVMRRMLKAKEAFETAKAAQDAEAVGRILTFAEKELDKK